MATLRENPRYCNNEIKGTDKKIENFWYYNKWFILGGAFFLAVIIYFVVDVVTKEKYDSTVVFVSHDMVSIDQTDLMAETFNKYVEDFDGNGEVNTCILSITGYRNDTNPYSYSTDVQITLQLQLDESAIWITDSASLDRLHELDGFGDMFTEPVAFDSFFDSTDGLSALDGYYIFFKKTVEDPEAGLYKSDRCAYDALLAAAA